MDDEGSVFSVLSFLAIVVSVGSMTLDAWGNPPAMADALNAITYAISWVFCIEVGEATAHPSVGVSVCLSVCESLRVRRVSQPALPARPTVLGPRPSWLTD